jgi:hypothetical protein
LKNQKQKLILDSAMIRKAQQRPQLKKQSTNECESMSVDEENASDEHYYNHYDIQDENNKGTKIIGPPLRIHSRPQRV